MAASNKNVNATSYHKYDRAGFPDREALKTYIETILLCSDYKHEYDQCTSREGRKYQDYVYGENLDCSYWKDYYNMCRVFKTNKDPEVLEELADFEESRMDYRLQNARNNDVWEYRTSPPPDWPKSARKIYPQKTNRFRELNANQDTKETEVIDKTREKVVNLSEIEKHEAKEQKNVQSVAEDDLKKTEEKLKSQCCIS